jgi:hypothetical protein
VTIDCTVSEAAVDATRSRRFADRMLVRGDKAGNTNLVNATMAGLGSMAFKTDLKLCMLNTGPLLSPGYSF